MKYNELVKINENFQYSVNLQFDLNNINKIKNYIPTNDSCEILKFYINSIINGKNRATTLIGPYGKGKSHLLLVLLTLISDYEKEDEIIINDFIEKVKSIDYELYNLLVEIRTKKIKLLPIIINSNYNDLNQAFLLGLTEALERENINNLVVNTYFDLAYDVIINWENNYKDIVKDIKKCLEEYSCSIKELKKNLKKYSKEHYEMFKDLYKCISRGQDFNPLVNGDIIKIYKDINYELEKLGYSGMFIAFDEFSKYLESSNEGLMRDLKILQDFAELSSRTGKEEQLHLSCITHKSMNEYFKDNENKLNAFKTVEGRFKTIYFNRSLEQHYEIISNSLIKEKGFDVKFRKFYDKNEKFYSKIQNLDMFLNVNLLTEKLFEGCFPLNPITVYSLVQLSEKVAQNERTLFTFITDDDQNGFKNFIDNNIDGLFTVDKIYDYFKPALKKIDDIYIKNIFQRTESLLKKNVSDYSKKILKVISIIYMIKDLETFCPSDEMISLSLFIDENNYKIAIEELISKSLLRRKKITDELDFATTYSNEITKEIKLLVESKFEFINEKETLNKIVDNWYSLPRKYNDDYKMTRFFLNIFMTEDELEHISSFESFFDNFYCDGIVINLLRTNRNIDGLIENFQTINDDRMVLKIAKSTFTKKFSNLLKEYEAINYIKTNSNISDESVEELDIIEKEIIDAVQEVVKEIFSEDNVQQYVYKAKIYKKVSHISSLLSEICKEIYNMTPIINNEMINKLELSAPIKKARNIVIDSVLSHDLTLIKSPTSAEATIYKSIVDKKDEVTIFNVLSIIKDFIKSSDNNKKSFRELYKILLDKPYSIRKGVIPVLLSIALYDYSNNILLYYLEREIELNSENLVKINDNPDKYFIQTERGTSEKIDYITNLMTIFSIPKTSDSLMINIRKTVEGMKKWILSMPRLIRECNNGKDININNEYIEIKSKLLRPDINNNEFLFKNIPDIINQNNLSMIVVEINKMKNQFDGVMRNYILELIDDTKDIFLNNYKGSLNSLFKDWTKKISEKSKLKIYDVTTKNFMNYILTINSHDDSEVLENIARIVTGFYVEDWQPVEKDKYLVSLKNISEKLTQSIDDESQNNKILLINGDATVEKSLLDNSDFSAIGSTMKNNIEELIEEYGESLSEQEKVNILVDILKKYL